MLGGDGTMLRAFHEFLGTRRAGDRRQLRPRSASSRRCSRTSSRRASRRVFAGDYVVHRVADARVRARTASACRRGQRRRRRERRRSGGCRARVGDRRRAARHGPVRRDHLRHAVAARPRTTCRTTAPCSMWGIDAMAVSSSRRTRSHARPLVVPRGRDVVVTNRNPDVAARAPRRRAARRARSSRTAPSPSGSATQRSCSRRCRTRRSSAATARPSRLRPFGLRRHGYDRLLLHAAPHREPRPVPRGRARVRAGAERDHGRDGRRQDDPRPGHRPPARRPADDALVGPPARRPTSRPSWISRSGRKSSPS